jgi:hypothetical protein
MLDASVMPKLLPGWQFPLAAECFLKVYNLAVTQVCGSTLRTSPSTLIDTWQHTTIAQVPKTWQQAVTRLGQLHQQQMHLHLHSNCTITW